MHENFTVDGFFDCASDGATCSSHAATKSSLKSNVNKKKIIKIYTKNYQNSYEKLMYALKNIVSRTESFFEIFKKFRKS